MDEKQRWIESKAKERISLNFVHTLLEKSGYDVMDYGIENHNHEIVQKIATNYNYETNRRLLCMPDYVIVDNNTLMSYLLEVKWRSYSKDFDMNNDIIYLKVGYIKNLMEYWKDLTLMFIFNVRPLCICVDINKVNWNIHYRGVYQRDRNHKPVERWNFSGIYQLVNYKFPLVTSEIFKETEKLLDMKPKYQIK